MESPPVKIATTERTHERRTRSLWHGLLTVPPGRPKVSVLLDRAALVPAVFGCLAMLSSVTYGSGDSDSLTCDNNTGRMTQYKFNVGSQSMTGALTWNQNGTLQQLAITDPFNSADQQTCNYTYDDLARINTVNCGSGFSQSFGIGALGNITKTGTLSFSPTYNGYTNQITSVGGQSYTYDADGDLTSTGTGTGTNAYTWDAFGKMTSDTPSGGSSIGIDYDALGRAAMTNVNGSSYTEFVYAPDGSKLALMNGQTLYKARVPLTGGGIAIYDPTGLVRYWHSDWQGTMRLVSNPSSPTYYWSGAYAPYGETYALGSNPFVTDFASLMGDTSGELNDATFREYNPTEGRWMSPDPAGLAAVDLTNPQSLNRYAYVRNNPTTLIDPTGLYCTQPDANGVIHCVVNGDSGGGAGGGGNGYGGSGPAPCSLVVVADPRTPPGGCGGSGGGPGGAAGSTSQSTPAQAPKRSFVNCVQNASNYFSLQSVLQGVSGGRLGNSWLASAFLGNSFSSAITAGQYLFSSSPSAPSAGQTASTVTGEILSDVSGPTASSVAQRVPNLAVTVAATAAAAAESPTSAVVVSVGGSLTVTVPLNAAASAGANLLNVFGAVKLPYDTAVTSISALVCSL
jgi:RHS repeat-associated protein